jgi:hypothetical protein
MISHKSSNPDQPIDNNFRQVILESDIDYVRLITCSTGFFRDDETEVFWSKNITFV